MKEGIFTAIVVLSLFGVVGLRQVERMRHEEGGQAIAPTPAMMPPAGAGMPSSMSGGRRVHFYPTEARPAAPGFDLPCLGGERIRLADLAGRVVMVNFWATWCEPCIMEMPSLEKLREQLEGPGFELVTISVDEEPGAPARLLSQLARVPGGRVPGYVVALDPGGKLAAAYGTSKFPETYVIGADGKLLVRFIGPRDWSQPMYSRLVRTVIERGGMPQMGAMSNGSASPGPPPEMPPDLPQGTR